MEIPEALLFEMLGRKEVALEVARRQVADLVQRVRRAEEAAAQAGDSQASRTVAETPG